MCKVSFFFTVCILCFTFSFGGTRHAVLVGCNKGGHDLENLRYAEKDAKRFGSVLRKTGDFPSGQVKVLLHPDREAFWKEMKRVSRKVKNESDRKNSHFLFYFSGHSDGESLLLGDEKVSLYRVKKFLDSCGAGVRIGIFDACHSGAVIAFKGGRSSGPLYFRQSEKVKGQVIIASAAAHQQAQESETLKGSIFTHHWLNGLNGSADYSGDRHITLHEAYQYAYRKTVETSALTGGGLQHPSYNFNIHGEGDICLTNLSQSRIEGILFDRTSEGTFLILSSDYNDVFADFTKKSGQEFFISLSPGTYRIINARDGDVFTLNKDVRKGGSEYVTHAMLKNRPLVDATRIKGRERKKEKTTSEVFGQMRDLSFGPGTGVVSRVSEGSESGLLLTAAVDLALQNSIGMFVNAHLLPLSRSFGLEAGVNASRPVNDFQLYAGAGPGIWYTGSGNVASEGALGVRTHVGFSKRVNSILELQAQIPLVLLFAEQGELQTGIEMRFIFRNGK
ncbi:MAG: caspase domain-containing protein [Chitinispirillaceae bacterium]